MHNKIGVFDSGIGGLNILSRLVEILPGEDFIYYGDGKNCPYGTKTDDELMKITCRIVDYLKKCGCGVIVIACNTATTRCMKKLRQLYPELIFIGTVPAVKMACDNKCHNTLVLATDGTIASERVHELVRDNKNNDQNIYLIACTGLAEAIEDKNDKLIDEILVRYLSDYLDKDIDSIVLGCTHYPWARENILKLFPDVLIFDGIDGVAREVKRQLELNNLINNSLKGEVIILDSIE